MASPIRIRIASSIVITSLLARRVESLCASDFEKLQKN